MIIDNKQLTKTNDQPLSNHPKYINPSRQINQQTINHTNDQSSATYKPTNNRINNDGKITRPSLFMSNCLLHVINHTNYKPYQLSIKRNKCMIWFLLMNGGGACDLGNLMN